jgi:predicted anti-sigma-YlaC factor YlaD
MTNENELTCKEIVELVTDYLEHTLLPEMRMRFEAHVEECPGCDTYVEQVQQTISLLHKLAQEPVFPGTKEELLSMFRNLKKA